jgi:hypothetical protein
MTPLKKAVTRRSEERMRDRSKFRRIVVTLYPAGFIGLRLEKCRHEETLSMRAAFETAVQTRVMRERAEQQKAGSASSSGAACKDPRVRGRPGMERTRRERERSTGWPPSPALRGSSHVPPFSPV